MAAVIVAVITLTPKGGPGAQTAPTAPSTPGGEAASDVTADAQLIQRTLIARGQPWEFAMGGSTQGDPTKAAGVASRTRNETRSLRVVIASEHVPTLRAFITSGHGGEQSYCAQLVDRIRALGYVHLERVLVDVFFGEADLHAQLTWSAAGGNQYSILDGDVLTNTLSMPRPGASPLPAVTPFPEVPSFQ